MDLQVRLDDYYEAYNEHDLRWVRRIDYLLQRHQIPRCIVKQQQQSLLHCAGGRGLNT